MFGIVKEVLTCIPLTELSTIYVYPYLVVLVKELPPYDKLLVIGVLDLVFWTWCFGIFGGGYDTLLRSIGGSAWYPRRLRRVGRPGGQKSFGIRELKVRR
jgi:hypothetical protein